MKKIIGLGIILLVAVVLVATTTAAAEINFTDYQKYTVQIQSPKTAEITLDAPNITISNGTITVAPAPEIVIKPEVKVSLVPKEETISEPISTLTPPAPPTQTATPEAEGENKSPLGVVIWIVFALVLLVVAVFLYARDEEQEKRIEKLEKR